MSKRKPQAPLLPKLAGSVASLRQPGDIKVGDYVFLDAAFRRIADMRSNGACTRVLHFDDYHPKTVREAIITYRAPDRP
ncbi:hypothetical protein [Streptomyces sp. NPDC087294]|uniref:hypothetical protein n=1 Tax=Streptomyces sp. NPDC087294 TaxID=3365777 RepID=UPI0037F4134C